MPKNSVLETLEIKHFWGGACPQTPLEGIPPTPQFHQPGHFATDHFVGKTTDVTPPSQEGQASHCPRHRALVANIHSVLFFPEVKIGIK